jgi:hypothetical protein
MLKLTSSAVLLTFAQFVALAAHGYLYYGYEAKIFASYQIWLALVNILFPLIVSRNETRLIASEKNLEFLAVSVSWSRNIACVLVFIMPLIAHYVFSISITITIIAVLQALTMALIHFAVHLTILEKSILKANILRSASILLPPMFVVVFASLYRADEVSVVIFHFVTTLVLLISVLFSNENFRSSFVTGVSLSTVYRPDLLKSGGVAVINSLARQLPLIFINTFQNSNITADFALVQRIYNSPLSIIGTVAADFLKKRYKQGQLVAIRAKFVFSTFTINVCLFVVLLFLMMIVDQFIEIERIESLISLSLVIIIPFLIRSVASPLSIMFILNDKFFKDMVFQIFLIVATILIFVFSQTTLAYIYAFAFMTSIFYLIYGVASYNEISVSSNA